MSSKYELVKCFKANICPFCTGKCDKGITFTEDGAKCVDYERKEFAHKTINIAFWQY